MSIKESSATALVRFTGLGIICFNKEKRRGEIAVIRDERHALAIKVQQPRFQDGSEKDIIAYQDIATHKSLPEEGIEIEIKAVGNSAVDGYEIYQNGDFDRLSSDDVNDFRWIVNMDNLHGETSINENSENKYPITKLFIGNGLFYAHKLDTNLCFEKVEKDAEGKETSREVFGNIAETIGVKIESDEVSLKICIGDKEETHLLSRINGLPFRIEISNMDYSEDAVFSDMLDYQKYISNPNGTSIELEPIKEDNDDNKTSGGSVGRLYFCHAISCALNSIEEL